MYTNWQDGTWPQYINQPASPKVYFLCYEYMWSTITQSPELQQALTRLVVCATAKCRRMPRGAWRSNKGLFPAGQPNDGQVKLRPILITLERLVSRGYIVLLIAGPTLCYEWQYLITYFVRQCLYVQLAAEMGEGLVKSFPLTFYFWLFIVCYK